MDKLNPDLKSPTFPRTEFNKLDITKLRGALTGAVNDGATSPTSPTTLPVKSISSNFFKLFIQAACASPT